MIDKKELTQVVNATLEGTDLFLVDIKVSTDNVIDIALDSMNDVSIEDCIAVDKAVHAAFNQDEEDYELTVGSYGISAPLLVLKQYEKNLGEEVEVVTRDGRKLKGTLSEANEDSFTIVTPTKTKVEGKKRPELVDVETTLPYDAVKQTKCIIKF
ncbi:MAG: ribosome assembly cofactor RimP [Muribaculaceae bacterium]|nr:ribosome assembly cofactor RimP [Muribaculaceae bacterium]